MNLFKNISIVERRIKKSSQALIWRQMTSGDRKNRKRFLMTRQEEIKTSFCKFDL